LNFVSTYAWYIHEKLICTKYVPKIPTISAPSIYNIKIALTACTWSPLILVQFLHRYKTQGNKAQSKKIACRRTLA
jgi:hypothetical protein